MIKLLQKRREFLCAQIVECRRLIDAAPPGKLEICRDRNGTKWYVKPERGNRVYLPKSEFETARLLAEKRIAASRLQLLEKELRATEYHLAHLPKEKDFFDLAKNECRFIELRATDSVIPWQHLPHKSNPSFTDNLKYPSPSGHLLRSKSECLIDMELFYRKIPFRYENELSLNGDIIYPDFSVYNNATGETRYWEHFGMMDDSKYRNRAIEKISNYISRGFIPGENIYFTYERSDYPITMTIIDRVIDEIEAWLYQYEIT